MRKFWKKGVWLLFVAGIGTVLGFAKSEHKQIPCEIPSIIINQDTGHDFVTNEMVLEKLNNIGYSFQGNQLCEVDLHRVESEIMKISGVAHVEAYTYVNGGLQIDVVQRRPILRVINYSGSSFYIDEKGLTMPISDHYSAKVPVVSGNFNEPLNANINEIAKVDSLADKTLLDDMFIIASTIDTSDFWKNQIVQIHVNRKKEFEMIPRVGNQRILFGSSESAEGKFKKLEIFYKKGIDAERLNLYDTLSVEYKGQIVCSKIN
jgi:cell division protein FtsQ